MLKGSLESTISGIRSCHCDVTLDKSQLSCCTVSDRPSNQSPPRVKYMCTKAKHWAAIMQAGSSPRRISRQTNVGALTTLVAEYSVLLWCRCGIDRFIVTSCCGGLVYRKAALFDCNIRICIYCGNSMRVLCGACVRL